MISSRRSSGWRAVEARLMSAVAVALPVGDVAAGAVPAYDLGATAWAADRTLLAQRLPDAGQQVRLATILAGLEIMPLRHGQAVLGGVRLPKHDLVQARSA